MKGLLKVGYKLIVVFCIITTLFIFIVDTPVSFASKVKEDAFYYSGTTKGSYTVSKSFWEKLLDALGAILDYLLGIMTMGIRVVFVGWTALLEQSLTWLLEGVTGSEVNAGGVEPVGIVNSDDYITIEAIVFNKVPLFDIDVFDTKPDDKHNSLGQELKEGEKSDISEDSFIMVLRQTIAGWYYTFRLMALMAMLILLIYIGVQLAVASSIKQKALYKQVFKDWVVGLVLVFMMHYIILGMVFFNEILVSEISKTASGYAGEKAVYEYGIKERAQKEISNAELEMSIYDEVRTRAYDAKLTVGTVGMILYMILVYYAWKFSFIYLKRYLVVVVLLMMSPFVAVSYAYNKVRTGKTPIFTNWLKELFFMIILQSIHALLYVVFFKQALAMSLASIGGMIFSFLILRFISQAEEIFKKIFNINGKLTNDVAGSKLQDIGNFAKSASLGVTTSKTAAAMTKGAARIASKPARVALNAGFGKAMEIRANRWKKQEEENASSVASKLVGKPTTEQKKEARKLKRENKLSASIESFNLLNKTTDLTDEERKKLLRLRSIVPTRRKIKNLSEDDYIERVRDKNKKYSKKLARAYHRTNFVNNVANKWNKIMDPYQYVTEERDENGRKTYKRKKTTYEHENWGPIMKHLGKKEDGVGKTFAKYDFNFMFDVNKSETKALLNFWKTSIAGFTGILLGLPLSIAEPSVGMVFLAKGISDSHKIFGGQNRAKLKNLRGFSMDTEGKYHFVGFNGKAVDTIAQGMEASARESVENYNEAVEEHNATVVKKVKKHKKLYYNVVYDAANAHQADNFRITSNPGRAFATIATGNILTGHLFQNLRMNSYLMYHEYQRDLRRRTAKQKEYEGTKSLEEFLGDLADKYDEVEEERRELSKARHTKKIDDVYDKKIEDAYSQEIEDRINEIDNMSDSQLLLQFGNDEEIVVETTVDGKRRISPGIETRLIEKAIIETVQKSGMDNLEEYNLEASSAKVELVKKAITGTLISQGVINKTENAADIIEDLDKKILDRSSKMRKNNPTAVRDKIIDSAIMAEMQEGRIDNPNEVSSDNVMGRIDASLASVPTSESAGVISSLNNGTQSSGATPTGGVTPTGVTPTGVQTTGRQSAINQSVLDQSVGNRETSSSGITRQAIQSRKSIISSGLDRRLSDRERASMKDELKQQAIKALDLEIATALAEQSSDGDTTTGGKEQTRAVLEMLQANTEREEAKKELLLVSRGTTKEERRKKYISDLYDENGIIDSRKMAEELAYVDGSRRLEGDGSRRVRGDGSRSLQGDGSRRLESDGSRSLEGDGSADVLAIMKKVREQKNI